MEHLTETEKKLLTMGLEFLVIFGSASHAREALSGTDFDGIPGEELEDAEALARLRSECEKVKQLLE